MRSTRLWSFVAWLVASAAIANPYQISYGGRLVDQTGKPLAGPVDLRITFFRSLTGNDQVNVALPDFPNTTLQEGLFQIFLPLNTSDINTLFAGSNDVYVQVESLSSGTVYPRQKFTAVPYALKVPINSDSLTFDANGQLSFGNASYTLKIPPAPAGAANKVLKSDPADATGKTLMWADDLTGGVGSITSSDVQDGSIVDADISGSAGIAVTKITGLGAAATKNVGTGAGDVAAGVHSHSDATTTTAGFMSAADKVRVNAAVTTADNGTVSGTMITNDTITDSDISSSAGIAVSKISGLGGLAAKSAVGSAEITDGSVSLADLSQTICTGNRVLRMNSAGTALVCSDAPTVITADTTYNATAGDCASVLTILDALKSTVIVAPAYVTISLPDGTYNCASTIRLTGMPYGSRIKIVGNTTTPTNVVLNFTSAIGIFAEQGSSLGLVNGMRIVGTQAASSIGIAANNSMLFIGPKVILDGFDTCIGSFARGFVEVVGSSAGNGVSLTNCQTGMHASSNSSIIALYSSLVGTGVASNGRGAVSESSGFVAVSQSTISAWGTGVSSSHGGTVYASSTTVSGCGTGFLAQNGAMIEAYGSTATGNQYGFNATLHGYISATSATASNNTTCGFCAFNRGFLAAAPSTATNNGTGYTASIGGYINATGVTVSGNTTNYDPSINAFGNAGSMIAQ